MLHPPPPQMLASPQPPHNGYFTWSSVNSVDFGLCIARISRNKTANSLQCLAATRRFSKRLHSDTKYQELAVRCRIAMTRWVARSRAPTIYYSTALAYYVEYVE